MNKEQDIDNQLYKYLSPDLYCYVHNYIVDLKKQITQLTNNWNELEEWIKENFRDCEIYIENDRKNIVKGNVYIKVLNKMKEIKENNEKNRFNL